MNRQAEIASLLRLDQLMGGGGEPTMPTQHSNFDEGGRWRPPREVRDRSPGYDPNRTLADDLPGLAMAAAPFAMGPAAAAYSRMPALVKMGLPFLYGMTSSARDAEPSGNADLQELRAQLEQQGSPRLTELQAALKSARDRQASVDAEAGRARPGSQARSADAARRSASDEVARLQAAVDAETERSRGTAMDRANAVMMARSEGEAERKRILDAAPKTFAQTYGELQKDLPALPDPAFLPLVAGAGAVAATKALPVASSWRALGTSDKLLKQGGAENVAKASELAARHSGNPKILSVPDAAVGAVTGAGAAAIPVAYDRLSQPTYNPERLAADAYLASLLEIDPRRAQAEARAKATSEANPATQDASLLNYGVKALIGAAEGALGGKGVGLLAESMKPRFNNAKSAAAAFSDERAAELLRMKGAEKYGKQAVTVPKPPPYQPPAGATPPNPPPTPPGANPEAGGGPTLAGPAAIAGGGPPNLPIATATRPQASRSTAYGDSQKAVVRPLVESELAAGNSVPNWERVSSELTANGVKIPGKAPMSDKLAAADSVAKELMAQGVSAETIAQIMGGIMRRNTPGFPAIAGPIAAGAASAASRSAPDQSVMDLYALDQAMRGGM